MLGLQLIYVSKKGPRWFMLEFQRVLLLLENKPTISIESGNGLSPVLHQAIIWNIEDFLLIGPYGRNFIEIWIKYNAVHSHQST